MYIHTPHVYDLNKLHRGSDWVLDNTGPLSLLAEPVLLVSRKRRSPQVSSRVEVGVLGRPEQLDLPHQTEVLVFGLTVPLDQECGG